MGRGINRGHQRRQELSEKAAELAEARAARTPTQQLALLDERLGAGVGASKERAKLAALIENSKAAKEKGKK